MGVLKELWTGELLTKFRHENEFLSRIANRNDFVNNNAIHMADIGADPDVLINNTTYPIATAGREDSDVSIALDKFDTTNTKITDDELYALPYDKNGSVLQQHREVLEEKTAEKAAHSLAPTVATILTSGADNGETNARNRMTVADIIAAKKHLDDLKIPKKNRELVLCNEHIQDLLLVDEKFAKQYQDIEAGKVMNMYGFILSEFVANPKYKIVSTVYTKKAFGEADDAANDYASSFFYYIPRAVQARGDVMMYNSKAENDPANRESVVGFRLYHICLPKKSTGFGAIVSKLHS